MNVRSLYGAFLGVSALFILSTNVSADNLPKWFEQELTQSRFCAVCEFPGSRDDPSLKIVQLLRGNKSGLDFFAKAPYQQELLSSRHLLVLSSSNTTDDVLILEDSVLVPTEERPTSDKLRMVKIELSRIVAFFNKR